jgi:hypothetical protein
LRRTLRKKVKIEITDEEGTKYSLAMHGAFSDEKVTRMIEVLNLLGQEDHNMARSTPPDTSTTYGRIISLIQSSYSAREFSSADIARDFEDRNASPIPLSTVSTYLARLADRGVLKRQKFGNSWVYRVSHVPSDHVAT